MIRRLIHLVQRLFAARDGVKQEPGIDELAIRGAQPLVWQSPPPVRRREKHYACPICRDQRFLEVASSEGFYGFAKCVCEGRRAANDQAMPPEERRQ